MKCYNHNDRDVVGQCTRCGKFLCKECTDKYMPILCDECYEAIQIEEENMRNQQEQDDFQANYEYCTRVRNMFHKCVFWGLIHAAITTWVCTAIGQNMSSDFIGKWTIITCIIVLLRFTAGFNPNLLQDPEYRFSIIAGAATGNAGFATTAIITGFIISTIVGPFNFIPCLKLYRQANDWMKANVSNG